MNKIAVSLQS